MSALHMPARHGQRVNCSTPSCGRSGYHSVHIASWPVMEDRGFGPKPVVLCRKCAAEQRQVWDSASSLEAEAVAA